MKDLPKENGKIENQENMNEKKGKKEIDQIGEIK